MEVYGSSAVATEQQQRNCSGTSAENNAGRRIIYMESFIQNFTSRQHMITPNYEYFHYRDKAPDGC